MFALEPLCFVDQTWFVCDAAWFILEHLLHPKQGFSSAQEMFAEVRLYLMRRVTK